MADLGTGYRRVVQLGSANRNREWTIHDLPSEGVVYWGVQAIDGAFAGSAFSVLDSIDMSVTGIPEPGATLASLALRCAGPNPFASA